MADMFGIVGAGNTMVVSRQVELYIRFSLVVVCCSSYCDCHCRCYAYNCDSRMLVDRTLLRGLEEEATRSTTRKSIAVARMLMLMLMLTDRNWRRQPCH